ncbi:hypothetical protein [Lishizhenia tianjinensis]|nr:hypothetical protein [Lishizhenia tianjinensis]
MNKIRVLLKALGVFIAYGHLSFLPDKPFGFSSVLYLPILLICASFYQGNLTYFGIEIILLLITTHLCIKGITKSAIRNYGKRFIFSRKRNFVISFVAYNLIPKLSCDCITHRINIQLQMLQLQKLKQIIIPIKIIILLFVFVSCNSKNSTPNKFIFSPNKYGWYVIVNTKYGEKKLDNEYYFPDDGILVIQQEGFRVNGEDLFFCGEKQFFPSGDSIEGDIRLCYYMKSINSGFNARTMTEQCGLQSINNLNDFSSIDLYFFRVNTNCDNVDIELDTFIQEVFCNLIEREFD